MHFGVKLLGYISLILYTCVCMYVKYKNQLNVILDLNMFEIPSGRDPLDYILNYSVLSLYFP